MPRASATWPTVMRGGRRNATAINPWKASSKSALNRIAGKIQPSPSGGKLKNVFEIQLLFAYAETW